MRRSNRLLYVAGTAVVVVSLSIVFFGMKGDHPPPPRKGQPVAEPVRPVERVPSVAGKDYFPPALTYTWKNYTTEDGLPSDKAHAIRVDGDRVWIGTDAGLVLYEDGAFRTFTEADGLAHPLILSIDVDERTGDVWAGTMGGLNRISGGRFETFTQLNSGLTNDVIYYVAVDRQAGGRDVWVTTAAGIGRYDTRTRQWLIYNEMNTPMHEPWTYAVAPAEDKVYFGIWASGLLEYDRQTGVWKVYHDPDGEFEMDIFPDDGPVHDVVSTMHYDDGLVWLGTYFGLSRFDGTRWKGFFDHDSGLVSNFINFARGAGPWGWIGTDRGLSVTNDGSIWYTYRRAESGRGETLVRTADGRVTSHTSPTAPVHNYVLGIDFQGERVWLATEGGVSVGTPLQQADAAR